MKHFYITLFFIVSFVSFSAAQNEFITTWQTTAVNESIIIPTSGIGYDYTVDWGDGTIETGFTGNATHSYTVADTYTVKILGDFPKFASLINLSNAKKLRTIEQWGNIEWETMLQAFSRCENLDITATDAPDLSRVTAMDQMFFGCNNLQSPDFSNWDTSSVTSMTWMFINARNFNGNVTTWDVGNVTGFSLMFLGTDKFNQDLSGWNVGEHTTNAISMNSMFAGAGAFDQNLGTWDLQKVTDIDDMFDNTGLSITNYDATLIGWAENGTTPNDLALGADSLNYCMGEAARNTLTSAPYNWTIIDAGLDCSDAFITTWQTTAVNQSITIPTTGSGYDYTIDWGDGTVESKTSGNPSHTYTTNGTYTVSIIGDFPRFSFDSDFNSATRIQAIKQWGTIAWDTMELAFSQCSNLVIDATDTPDLSNVSSTFRMFLDNTNLVDNGGAIGSWNVSTIENMSRMFEGCSNFNENINDWTVTGVKDMNGMFKECSKFDQPLNNWNTGSVEDMGLLFNEASKFNQDISGWNVISAKDMISMFENASDFNQNLSDWDISNLSGGSTMVNMFTNTSLSQENYDRTLIGWATAQPGGAVTPPTMVPINITLNADATYCFGEAARNTLVNDFGWTITDGGISTGCAATDLFITTWSITSNNEEIALPIVDTGLDFTIDWGDGIITNETEEAYHTYTNAGTYTIRISGNFNQIRFNGNADSRKIQTIEQWGSNKWTSMERAFKGCGSLEINATDAPDLSDATSMESMFEDGSCVDNGGNIGNWNVSTISLMNSMFRNAFMNENINTWNVSSVKSIDHMFQACEDFNYPLDQWVTTNLESAIETFADAKSFDQSVGDWDISNVSDFTDIFTNGTGMSDQNYDATLIGWATLESGESLSLNVSFGAGNLKFCLGESARNLLTSSTYNWSITDGGFGCDFTNAFITTWQTTTANESITIPTTGSGYNYAVDWGDGVVENGFTGDAIHQYTTAGTYTVRITGNFPRIFFNDRGSKNKILTVEQWGTMAWQSMAQAFNGCANLKLNATDTPNLSAVTTTRRMFAKNTNFEDLQNVIGTWDTGNVEDMNAMFIQSGFNHDIGNWDVSKVKDFDGMFYVCPNFDQDLGNWDISEAVTMRSFITTNSLATNNFSTENYDKTLQGWATLDAGETRIPRDVNVSIDLTRYCDAFVERFQLVNDYNWRISDLGLGCPEEEKFITTWETTTANETITIPTFSGESYRYVIEWGDNTTEVATSDVAPSHTYTNARAYTIKITGDFPRIYFNNSGDKEKILFIEQWGVQQWTSMANAFRGCTNLKLNADDAPDLTLVTSLYRTFLSCTNLEDLKNNIGTWNLENVTTISSLFEDTPFNENINGWNVSKVEDFSSMFKNNTEFNQPLNNWNTEKANDLTNMFDGATAFNQPIGMWDVALAQYFDFMFLNATTFDQNLASWDISNTSRDSMDGMLTGSAMSQTNYDATLIGWATLETGETRIPTDVKLDASTFYCLGETARNTLTSALYDWTINDAGKGCPEDFFITTWETTMANESITIPTKDLGYNYTVDWGDGTVESGFTGDATHQYAIAGTYTVKIVGDFPRINFDNSGDKEKILSIEQWGNIQWSSFRDSFYGCENLKLNADDIPDLSQVTELTDMFADCVNFEDLKDNIGSWDMSTIERINGTFYNCPIFNEDISGWVFTNLLRTDSAFEEAFAFNQDISSWNMATVTDMAYMFYNATSFNQPIGNWTLGNVEYIYAMFYGATSFNQELSNWDFSQVQNIEELFEGASSFDQDLSSWDISSVTNMSRIFIGSGLSQENYDNTLIGWATLETGETQIPTNLTLDADVAHCLSVDAVNTLTSNPYNWMVNDGGLGCPTPLITLLGNNPQIIVQGDSYRELGATTTYGAILTIDASGVNTNQLGDYTVTYNASTPSGASAVEVIRRVNVIEACPILSLPVDNFTISAASETCVDKNNGMISINATTELDYLTTINGVDYNFTSTLTVDNLTPGTYPVCIRVNGFTNCEQCFEVVIEDAESLAGKTELITETGTAKVNVEVATGTAPYIARINDEIVGEYTSNTFNVEVQHGDEVEISSSIACEGKLSTKVNLIDKLSIAPNPTQGDVTLFIPTAEVNRIQVALYNVLGVQISVGIYTLNTGKVIIPMEQLSQGVYFITVNEGEAFKIVKQ